MTKSRLGHVVAGGIAAAMIALTVGCAPGSGSGSTTTTPASSATTSGAAVNTDPSTMGDITLSVWDQEVRGSQNAEIEALNAAFQEKYPNITIKRNAQSFEDLQKTLKLALSGPDAPDVVEANNSRSQMGTLVTGSALIPLDPYAEAYGWTDRYPATVLSLSSYSADGKTFGSGNLYGLSQMGEVVGLYYNKDKLTQLGLSIPTTWSEFEEQLATIKATGETPLTLGDQDKWPAIHVFGPIQGAHTPYDQVVALGLGNAGADWTDANNTAAAAQLQDWVNKGYFNDDVLGLAGDDGFAKFVAGTGVYYFGGSWYGADMKADDAAKFGFFAPPPATAGDGPATTGGTSLPFAITSSSQHPDAAAAYINFLTSDDAMKVIADKGSLPVLHSDELAPSSGVLADIYKAYAEVTTKGHLLPYLDYATPTFSDTVGAALQDLIAGKQTPDQFTATLQADYAAFTKG
jgi:raffinose/stachyose/melibiose transport system substrate-binding protein